MMLSSHLHTVNHVAAIERSPRPTARRTTARSSVLAAAVQRLISRPTRAALPAAAA